MKFCSFVILLVHLSLWIRKTKCDTFIEDNIESGEIVAQKWGVLLTECVLYCEKIDAYPVITKRRNKPFIDCACVVESNNGGHFDIYKEIVNGHWGPWNNVTPCSVTCGNGVHVQKRHCDNPAPAEHGSKCKFDESGGGVGFGLFENRTNACNLGACPGGQILVSSKCWKTIGGCDAVENTSIILTSDCSETNPSHQFRYDDETGNLTHICSRKRVCVFDSPDVVVSSSCPALSGQRRWLITDDAALWYNGCVKIKNGIPKQSADCFDADSRSVFKNGDRGRVRSKFWKIAAYSSVQDLLSDPRFPDHPDTSTWLYTLDAVPYGSVLKQFGRQWQTIFISQETGNHTFKISVDNFADLYIGPSEADKVKILDGVGWSSYQEYRYASAPQYLVAGARYYMEVVMVGHSDGDNLSVGVIFPSGKTAIPITARHLISPE